MNNSVIEGKIIRKLQELEEAQQLQVLDFTESLVQKQKLGVPGKSLLSFAGSIPEEELELISQSIEKECSKIDIDEW